MFYTTQGDTRTSVYVPGGPEPGRSDASERPVARVTHPDAKGDAEEAAARRRARHRRLLPPPLKGSILQNFNSAQNLSTKFHKKFVQIST
jgi:hypothetical protein